MLPALFDDANWLKLMDPATAMPCPDSELDGAIANDEEIYAAEVQSLLRDVTGPAS